jgi:aminopeptidase N
MLEAAEKLYGPYRWGRYDVLVLPSSFPFGGMENPCLTFATPTILAGDRSLVSLVAHELAHSWSGNLVTNATWNDFWLNEGFTVYFERRIMEALEGKEYAEMLAVIGRGDLDNCLNDLGPASPDSRLKLELKGRDADDGMTDIAYEKGYLFLRMLEQKVGRISWDAFLNQYFEAFAFQSISTEKFLQYLENNLLKNSNINPSDVKLDEWIYQPDIPAGTERIISSRFQKAEKFAALSLQGQIPDGNEFRGWSAHEWLHFLRQLTGKADANLAAKLDQQFRFSTSGNSEIQFEWILLTLKANYSQSLKAAEAFLIHTGRRKFVLPLYKELSKTPEGRREAIRIFRLAEAGYHPVTRNSVQAFLNPEG